MKKEKAYRKERIAEATLVRKKEEDNFIAFWLRSMLEENLRNQIEELLKSLDSENPIDPKINRGNLTAKIELKEENAKIRGSFINYDLKTKKGV